jgi:hypothetical protein
MITIISGLTDKPIAIDQLKAFFRSQNGLTGCFYEGYPVIGTADGAFPIDGLLYRQKKA